MRILSDTSSESPRAGGMVAAFLLESFVIVQTASDRGLPSLFFWCELYSKLIIEQEFYNWIILSRTMRVFWVSCQKGFVVKHFSVFSGCFNFYWPCFLLGWSLVRNPGLPRGFGWRKCCLVTNLQGCGPWWFVTGSLHPGRLTWNL